MSKLKYVNRYKIPVSTVLFFLFVLIFPLRLTAQNLIATPECVVYDAVYNRYLVSCLYSGKVVEIDSNGNQKYFKEGLPYCFGNTISGGVFYISTGKTVKGYNLQNAAEVMSVTIPSSHQLDGMTADNAGNLYVADFHYSGSNDQIYKIYLNTNVYSVFVGPGHGLAESPQDLAYDERNNRLIVANYYNNSPIQAVNLSDSTVTNIVASSIGNFDGVARDNAGNYYFTSWGTGSVHKYDSSFANAPVVVVSGINGPSNLCYNHVANILAIPVFDSDTVIFHSLGPIGINNQSEVVKDFVLFQNYPNPFNPATTLSFYIKKSAYIKISVFDIKGNYTDMIFEGKINSGKHSFVWDGTQFSSGVYFYKLETIDPSRGSMFSETKKMVLIK
jgi:hypothetical protein